MHKFCQGLRMIGEMDIAHRDIHMNNVVLHFPELEPTAEELDNLQQYWHNLAERVYRRLISDLGNPNDHYQVKLIDFGLSKTLEDDNLTNTPVGVH